MTENFRFALSCPLSPALGMLCANSGSCYISEAPKLMGQDDADNSAAKAVILLQ